MLSPLCEVIVTRLENAKEVNESLRLAFEHLESANLMEGTHYFGGRHENLYVDREFLPEIQPVIDCLITTSAEAIKAIPCAIRAGFWFNKMLPGHETTRHKHDDSDELVSAVYYITVPHLSGNLILHLNAEDDSNACVERIIEPKAGMLVIFPPSMEHSVSKNRSSEMRLSVAFNLGTGNWG